MTKWPNYKVGESVLKGAKSILPKEVGIKFKPFVIGFVEIHAIWRRDGNPPLTDEQLSAWRKELKEEDEQWVRTETARRIKGELRRRAKLAKALRFREPHLPQGKLPREI